jgi:hypothetical protein
LGYSTVILWIPVIERISGNQDDKYMISSEIMKKVTGSIGYWNRETEGILDCIGQKNVTYRSGDCFSIN